MTSSNGNISALLAICAGISPVPGQFPSQRPVTRSFDVFFDLHLNKPLSKQSWSWWFEMPSRQFWRHCNVVTQQWHVSTVRNLSFVRLSPFHSKETLAKLWGKFEKQIRPGCVYIRDGHGTRKTFIDLLIDCLVITSLIIQIHVLSRGQHLMPQRFRITHVAKAGVFSSNEVNLHFRRMK